MQGEVLDIIHDCIPGSWHGTRNSSLPADMNKAVEWLSEARGLVREDWKAWLFACLATRAYKLSVSLGNLKKFWASQVALMVNNLPAKAREQEMQVWSLGLEDPLEKGMATHSSILPWRIPWTEEPGGLQSIGSQRVDWRDLVHHKGGWTPILSLLPGALLGFLYSNCGFCSPFLLQWISQKIFQNSSHNYHGTTVNSLQFPRAQHCLVLKTVVYWPFAT